MWVPTRASARCRGRDLVLVDGVFLLYLAVISASPVMHAWRAVRTKKDPMRMRSLPDLGRVLLPLVGAAIVITLALTIRTEVTPILLSMSLIGIGEGVFFVRHWWNPKRKRNSWLLEHLVFGGLSAVAALNSAAVFIMNALELHLPEPVEPLPWVLPILIGLPLIIVVRRRYDLPAPQRAKRGD